MVHLGFIHVCHNLNWHISSYSIKRKSTIYIQNTYVYYVYAELWSIQKIHITQLYIMQRVITSCLPWYNLVMKQPMILLFVNYDPKTYAKCIDRSVQILWSLQKLIALCALPDSSYNQMLSYTYLNYWWSTTIFSDRSCYLHVCFATFLDLLPSSVLTYFADLQINVHDFFIFFVKIFCLVLIVNNLIWVTGPAFPTEKRSIKYTQTRQIYI